MSTFVSLASDNDTATKMKVRKGTHSCRECKRRKTRCTYSSASEAICVGCQRRGTSCLSQEFDDEEVVDDGDMNLRGRLIKVETLLGQLMEKVAAEDAKRDNKAVAAADSLDHTAPYSQDTFERSQNIPYENTHAPISKMNGPLARQTNQESFTHQKAQATNSAEFQDKYMKIRHKLQAALPSQRVADILLGGGRASIYLQVLCNPQSAVFHGKTQRQSSLSALPSVTSHPVLLARKLLQLAICLQQLDPYFDDSMLDLGESREIVMANYLDLASSQVTSKDKLVDSLEGMECLVLEGAYLINSGNLRRAWLCVRRAMSLAQLMGFQRKIPRAVKTLDSTTQASCSVIWFRIVHAERYLSLLLGSPSAIADNSFASEENMTGDSSTDRMDKLHAVISGMIIERNETESWREFATTQNIDLHLQRASKSVPSNWWLPPDLSQRLAVPELMANWITIQAQIIHHNLLTLLHLPHMLSNAAEGMSDYSRSTCVNSSQEVLSRFIKFRTSIRVAFCCRLIDFCAFTAALTLLLAHIGSDSSFGNVPINQRLMDRKLVEKAIDTMEELSRVNGDSLSKKTAEVTRKLLAMELDSSNSSGVYKIRSVEGEGINENMSFHLKIPYFGTVGIEKERPVPLPNALRDNSTFTSSLGTRTDFVPEASIMENIPSDALGGDTYHHWNSSMQHSGIYEQTQGLENPFISFQNDFQGQDLAMPDFMAEADDWAFQGVDTTFFDSLFKGDLANQTS